MDKDLKKIMTSPVQYTQARAQILSEAENQTDEWGFEDEEACRYTPVLSDSTKIESLEADEKAAINGENAQNRKKNLSAIKFADQIKIDFIASIDYRILCRFLGVTSVNEIGNHPYQSHPLITLILMESINGFMEKEGFEFVGELNFDNHGNSIPVEKNAWVIKGKQTNFTMTGFLYFQKKDGEKKDNVIFFLYSDLDRGATQITCYTTENNKSKQIINSLQQYSKESNCLRGAKMKDVNMISASFSEVETKPEYTWDNFYYSDKIKDLLQLEVFDFVENSEKYNEYGISKRGIILHGRPGTGKTTLGNIICNKTDKTVIWITPEILSENNYKAISSIKALYKLADFLSPCIIILEDLDLFSQDRDKGGDIISLGALMNVLDGVNTISNSVTIGTTNRLKSIEGALRNRPGRFDRIVEISHLPQKLRRKMFRERLKDWKLGRGVLEYILNKTEEWTGAEVQEFINGLNLKHISSKRKQKRLDVKLAEEIIETMNNFGVGEASSSFGFGSKK